MCAPIDKARHDKAMAVLAAVEKAFAPGARSLNAHANDITESCRLTRRQHPFGPCNDCVTLATWLRRVSDVFEFDAAKESA